MNQKTINGIAVLTKEAAKSKGLRVLTREINPKAEAAIFDSIVGWMRRGNIPLALVKHSRGGVEIWRGPKGAAA